MSKGFGKSPQPKPIYPVPGTAPPLTFQHPKHGAPSQFWRYEDANGRLLMYALRFDFRGEDGVQRKTILPITFCELSDGRRAWRGKSLPSPLPLYGLKSLFERPASPVIVCEGEKAADAAAKMFADHVAVTSSGGANSAHKSDWTPLQGRRVVIWPDADEVGRGYAQSVAALVTAAAAASVRVIDVPTSFPDGWDVADPLPDGWDAQQVRTLLDEAPTYTAQGSVPAGKAPSKRAGSKNTPSGTPLSLATTELWPHPVNGLALLDELVTTFSRHIALPNGYAEILALWTLHAHALEASFVSPILFLSSAEKQCGKTLTLELLAGLVPRPLATSNITAPALFRTVEKCRPTLLIDEADSFMKTDETLRGILNSGHTRSGAFVIRLVGDDYEPQAFSTWCPKAVAGIGRLSGTVEDRSIVFRLRRRAPGEKIERVRRDRLPAVLGPIRSRAAKWVQDNLASLREADPIVPEELSDRAQDNWRPLLAIADAIDPTFARRAREVAVLLAGSHLESETSNGIQMLADLRNLFVETGKAKLASTEIVRSLIGREDRPWQDYKNGKALTPRDLAVLLKPFQIVPNTQREGKATFKGYTRASCEDAFSRYLPQEGADRSVTASQSSTAADETLLAIRNTIAAVPEGAEGEKLVPERFVTDVTDQTGATGATTAGPDDTGTQSTLKPCEACASRLYWFRNGTPVCAVCSPPADLDDVVDWVELPEAYRPQA